VASLGAPAQAGHQDPRAGLGARWPAPQAEADQLLVRSVLGAAMNEFQVGDTVSKIGGDYTFEGVVVAAFTKRNGKYVRYVVEDDRGLLFIFNSLQLALVVKP
jgi:hypothetical protein